MKNKDKASQIEMLYQQTPRPSIAEIARIVHCDRKAIKQHLIDVDLYVTPPNKKVYHLKTEDTKICSACPENGPQHIDNFTIVRKKDGVAISRCHRCKPCQSKYSNDRMHDRFPEMKRVEMILDKQIIEAFNAGYNTLEKLSTKFDRSIGWARVRLTDLNLFEDVRKKKSIIVIDERIALQIKSLFAQNMGTRPIAKKLGLTRHEVTVYYEHLGIDNSHIKPPPVEKPTEKICRGCPQNGLQLIDNFRKHICRGKYISHDSLCFDCERKRNNERGKANAKKKRKEDPIYVIRSNVSGSIYRALRREGASKAGESCLKYLPYTIEQLKTHLESLFEPWMTWENHGVYIRSQWKDDDISTWTWQIDHIKPHSTFKYTSMDSDEFRKCWALSNLCPLSSKQNNLDGTRRTRHNNA